MEKSFETYSYLYELALKEGMSTRTLRNKLRAKGYNGSFRGLLAPGLVKKFHKLLKDNHYESLKVLQIDENLIKGKEKKRVEKSDHLI